MFATAAPRIYTLSLHDALPISQELSVSYSNGPSTVPLATYRRSFAMLIAPRLLASKHRYASESGVPSAHNVLPAPKLSLGDASAVYASAMAFKTTVPLGHAAVV